jgi:hypothetical protein
MDCIDWAKKIGIKNLQQKELNAAGREQIEAGRKTKTNVGKALSNLELVHWEEYGYANILKDA